MIENPWKIFSHKSSEYQQVQHPDPLPCHKQLLGTTSRIVDWPHKSSRAFPAYFVLAHTPPGKFSMRSPIPRLLHTSTLNCEVLKSGYQKRRCTIGDISSRSKPFKLYLECYNRLYLNRTTS